MAAIVIAALSTILSPCCLGRSDSDGCHKTWALDAASRTLCSETGSSPPPPCDNGLVPEPQRTIGSNEYSIFLEATQAAGDQLAAIKSATLLVPGSFDLAIQLHESTIDNVASRILAGRTMTGEQLDRLMADVRQPAPIESMRGQQLRVSSIDSSDDWLSISAR